MKSFKKGDLVVLKQPRVDITDRNNVIDVGEIGVVIGNIFSGEVVVIEMSDDFSVSCVQAVFLEVIGSVE